MDNKNYFNYKIIKQFLLSKGLNYDDSTIVGFSQIMGDLSKDLENRILESKALSNSEIRSCCLDKTTNVIYRQR